MIWPARLEGGPYDGDSGKIRDSELPEALYVYRCPDCREIHWSDDDDERNSERYVYDRLEDGRNGHTGVYVYAELDLTDLPYIRECVDEPVAV